MSTVFRVEKNGNFTVMSNIHLKDRKLSLKAKGLLSVILSLPPEWDYTVKGLAKIVADGVDSVRTAVKELESFGYITRRQTRDELGKMSQNEYHVYENPKQNPDFEQPDNVQYTEQTNVQNSEQYNSYTKQTNVQNAEQYNSYTEQTNGNFKQSYEDYEQPKSSKSEKADNIFLASPLTENPLTEIPSTAERTTDTYYNILNTKKSNPQSSITHSRASQNFMEKWTERRNDRGNEDRENFISLICWNIEFDSFAEKEKVSELVKLMADVAFLRRKTVHINGGEVTVEEVRKRFLELRKEHIEQVLTTLAINANSIRNLRAYLITLLYNAPMMCSPKKTNAFQTNNTQNYAAPADNFNSSIDYYGVMESIKDRYRQLRER